MVATAIKAIMPGGIGKLALKRQRLVHNIHEFKRAFELLAGMLAEKKVRVIFRGTTCATDGDKIFLPELSILERQNMTEEEIDEAQAFLEALRGFLFHEVAHILFTDMDVFRSVQGYRGALRYATNAVEDVRIEQKMASQWRGAGVALKYMNEFTLQKVLDGLASDTHVGQIILGIAWVARTGKNHWFYEKLPPMVKKAITSLGAEVAECRKIASTVEAVDLAKRIIEKLEKMVAPPPPKPPPPPKAEPKQQAQQDDEEAPEDPGIGDEEDPDEGEEPDSDEGEGEDSDEDEDDSDEDEDEDEDEKPAKKAKAKSKASDEDDSDEDEEDEDEDEPEEDEDDSDEDEDEPEEDEDEDALSEEERERLKKEMEDEQRIEEEEERRKAENVLKGQLKVDPSIAGDRYLIYSTEKDSIEKAPDGDPVAYQKLVNDSRAVFGIVKRALANTLKARAYTSTVRELEEGDLDRTMLYRLATGMSERVFMHESQHLELRKTGVVLLVNESGSMRGSRMEMARQTAVLFSEVFDALSIPFAVYGHSTTYYEGQNAFKAATPEERAIYSRWGGNVFTIYKDFDEQHRHVKHRLTKMTDKVNTHDGEALVWAANKLLDQKNLTRRIIMTVDDGEPYPNNWLDFTMPPEFAASLEAHHRRHVAYVHEVVERITKLGVETVGLGMCTDSVKQFYPQHAVIMDAKDFPKVAMGELRKLLMPGTRKVK